MEELKILSYFASFNHISKKIALREKSLIKYLGNRWTKYSPEQQEELLNDLYVPYSIRQLYPSKASDKEGNEKMKQCWPVLKLSSGEKIMIWTWRDEHSGPFSWKSKSQQDLTLLDLDNENLTKQHNRCVKSETEEQETDQVIRNDKYFSLNAPTWTQVVLEEYSGCGCLEFQTPVHSPSGSASLVESLLEEVNPAFEGSVNDLSASASPSHGVVLTSPEVKTLQNITTDKQSDIQVSSAKVNKGKKTTSPNKTHQTGSFKKDTNKGKSSADAAQQLLIKDSKEEDRNAFSNPVMWSNFVGQTSTDSDDDIKQTVPVLKQSIISSVKEPDTMEMERGETTGKISAESSPDHTTQLLKPSSADSEELDKEEVLYIVKGQAGVLLSAQNSSSTDDIELPKTGFDFLDNW
ncbi:hypothetical protein C0Q70_13066 [Pomacea canaliculata]|uniref:DUF4706 domain-containing protein n=1 Tax=Pomacea canaliculata TaxID=400727 RepID=A0A2T7NW52_POMCA|nr:hypothetical protein C0Q70_13066 [Pomacea canaliculata]